MPRGRKKAIVETMPAPVVEETTVEIEPEEEPAIPVGRKPYPTHIERIAAADEQIRHWEKLNAKRRTLVAITEETLRSRKDALAKGEAEILRLTEWKQRLIEIKDGLPSTTRNHTRAKFNELLSALKSSGKSMDDLLDQLKVDNQGA